MLAFRNGLKTGLRTPGKTLLFLLILTVTAVLLTVSFCVFGAVRSYLEDCDDYFHTIAELEFMGKDYPDSQVWDQALEQTLLEHRDALETLLTSPAVRSFEPASAELALSPDIHRWDDYIPDAGAAVLRVRIMSYSEDIDLYTAIIYETLYARRDYTNKAVILQAAEGNENLRTGCSYLLAGRFYTGDTANPCFQQEQVSLRTDSGLTDLPLQEEAPAALTEDDLFYRYAQVLAQKNNACPVRYTAALEDLYPFHQQVLTLTQGRYFTQAEYDAAAHVCVVSEKLAGILDLGLGDVIPFSVFRAEGDLYDPANLTRLDQGDYEIVGITSHDAAYPYWVFLPDARAAERGVRPVNGYTLGQFRLENQQVPAFLEAMEPLLEAGFRLSVYDQGYSAATEPVEELLFLAQVFLGVCLLLAACAAALQSYLFILRQRETARTMHALGAGGAHICLYFLSGALALAGLGAGLGALAGHRLEDRVFGLLRDFAAQHADGDLRFSASRLAAVRTLDFSPTASPAAYGWAAALLLSGVLLFSLIFAGASLRQRTNRKRRPQRRRLPQAARSSRLSGPFQYGLLSLLRGRFRSGAVLLLGLVAALFLGRLTDSLAGYETQLAAYRENAVITGTAVDLYGKRYSGLVLKSHPIARLFISGLVEDACVTTSLGHIQLLHKAEGPEPVFQYPESSFAYETLFDRISKASDWMGTSSVRSAPLFHYSKSGSVEWLEGWSEADLRQTVDSTYQQYDFRSGAFVETEYSTGPAICAISREMLEEQGLALGDEIDCLAAYTLNGSDVIQALRLRIVAVYTSPSKSTSVFSPVTFVRPGEESRSLSVARQPLISGAYWFSGERWTPEELTAVTGLGLSPLKTYSSFTFTLKDSLRLEELRETLSEAGFTWVRSGERTKNYALIEDEVYLNTVHSMERQIQYVGVLYDALYLLTGVIGFALAWLLVQSRRREIAVMRALGTQPGRILLNFLLEQLMLMAAGLGLGLLVCRFTDVRFSQTQEILTAAFLGIWCLATLLCLCAALRKRSFAALTEPE